METEGWEVEACGGTHCESTGEVGLIKIIRTERIQDGVERVIYAAGGSAVKTVQEIEAKVVKAAELLGVQPEKVEKTLGRMVSEWRQLRREKENLTKSLAKFMAEKYLSTAEKISGLRVVSEIIREEEANLDLLINVSNELVKAEPKVVAIFVCVDQNARLIAMVGKEAQRRGVDAREIARQGAPELGGGGSGKPEFAQGGGTHVEGASKALEKAKMVIRKRVKG